MFRAFVFTLASSEEPLSYIYVAENGRIHLATLPVFLYARTYLAEKSLRGIVSKSSFATELHFYSKNPSCILSGRRQPKRNKRDFLPIFILNVQCLPNMDNASRILVLTIADGLLFWLLVLHPDQPHFSERLYLSLRKTQRFPFKLYKATTLIFL